MSSHTPLSNILLRERPSFLIDDDHGIVNERLFYFNYSGLPSMFMNGRTDLLKPFQHCPPHGSTEIIISANVGFLGWNNCSDLIIVDRVALADPFLSRLAPQPYPLQAGHLHRNIPDGYIESKRQGNNALVIPDLRELYSTVTYVTSGPLFDWKRARQALSLRFRFVQYQKSSPG